MRRTGYLFAALVAAGCQAGAPPVPLQTVTVNAPFDRTWNAVIDIFTTSDLPIATIDKSSGLIAASSLGIGMTDGNNWASCPGIIGPPASRGTFNVVVRQGVMGTDVRVTASFSNQHAPCRSKGVFERWIQTRVKEAAEAKP